MCCLFGMIDYGHTLTGKQKNRILSILAAECEARGTDAAGIAYNSGGRLRVYKRPGPAHELHFSIPDCTYEVMGHTRMTTQGSEKKVKNNHPFLGKAGGARFALAHNGVLHNDHVLRRTLKLPSTKIETDSYIAVQLIEKKRSLDFASLKYMAEQVEGSFTFTVLDEHSHLYVVKGDNPFCLYHFPKSKLYLYASTEEILEKALQKLRLPLGKREQVQTQCGDILRIDRSGTITRSQFDASLLYWNRCPPLCAPYGGRGAFSLKSTFEQEYMENLKTVAAAYGYAPEQIDSMLCRGFTTDELEELLYCGEL